MAAHDSVRRFVMVMPLALSALPVPTNANPPNARCTGSGRLETSAERAVRNDAGPAGYAGTARTGAKTYHVRFALGDAVWPAAAARRPGIA
jgi:hypothetical protein